MNPDIIKEIFFWMVFGLFMAYIILMLLTLFGAPDILKNILSFPSFISKYSEIDYKKFGKVEENFTG